MDERGAPIVPDNCVTGEEFEEWLYEEPSENSDNSSMSDEVFDIWVHSFKPKGVDK